MASNQRIYQDRTLRLEAHRNVLIAVWSDAPTLPQARVFHRESEQFCKQNPAGQALAQVVLSGVPLFTEPVREELVKLMKNPSLYTLGAAHVILVSGMTASAVRAFLSTAVLLARPKTPHRVFGALPDAVTWLHGQLGGTQAQWTGNELRDAIEAARRDR